MQACRCILYCPAPFSPLAPYIVFPQYIFRTEYPPAPKDSTIRQSSANFEALFLPELFCSTVSMYAPPKKSVCRRNLYIRRTMKMWKLLRMMCRRPNLCLLLSYRTPYLFLSFSPPQGLQADCLHICPDDISLQALYKLF